MVDLRLENSNKANDQISKDFEDLEKENIKLKEINKINEYIINNKNKERSLTPESSEKSDEESSNSSSHKLKKFNTDKQQKISVIPESSSHSSNKDDIKSKIKQTIDDIKSFKSFDNKKTSSSDSDDENNEKFKQTRQKSDSDDEEKETIKQTRPKSVEKKETPKIKRNYAKKIKNAVKNTIDVIGSGITNVKDASMYIGGGIKNGGQKFIDVTTNQIGNAVDITKEVIKTTANLSKEAVQQLAPVIGETIIQTIGLIDKAGDLGKHVIKDAIIPAAKLGGKGAILALEYTGKGINKALELGNTVLDVTDTAIEHIKSKNRETYQPNENMKNIDANEIYFGLEKIKNNENELNNLYDACVKIIKMKYPDDNTKFKYNIDLLDYYIDNL